MSDEIAYAAHDLEYDDNLIRQILECVVVESNDKIKVVFKGGGEVITSITV